MGANDCSATTGKGCGAPAVVVTRSAYSDWPATKRNRNDICCGRRTIASERQLGLQCEEVVRPAPCSVSLPVYRKVNDKISTRMTTKKVEPEEFDFQRQRALENCEAILQTRRIKVKPFLRQSRKWLAPGLVAAGAGCSRVLPAPDTATLRCAVAATLSLLWPSRLPVLTIGKQLRTQGA